MKNSRLPTLGLIVAGLLLGAVVFRNGDLAWMALPFLAYLVVGIAQAPAPEELRLRAERTCLETKKEGGVSVEVAVKVLNEGERGIRLSLMDPPMRGMRITEGDPGLCSYLRPGEEAELRYVFESSRGSYSWDNVLAISADPFDLAPTEMRLEAAARVIVQPAFRRMRPFPLRPPKTLSSPGSIPTRFGGSGTDFWGIREYQQGDPLKRLDWRLTARKAHSLFTKEYIQEKTAEIVLVLDSRAKTDYALGGLSLFEREIEAVAALAEMLIRQGQRVGLIVSGRESRTVFPDYGRIQLRRILNCLAQAETEGEASRNGAREGLGDLPIRRYSRSALLVIVSPLVADDESAFSRLRGLGYQGMVISPDSYRFMRPRIAGDRSSLQALRLCRIERKIRLNAIANLSFPVIDWRIDRPLAPQLRTALARPPKAWQS
jgi:uncharacterized protein (DUF58 family)